MAVEPRTEAQLRELLRFLLVGLAVVVVDFAVYFGLLRLRPGLNVSLAKASAFVAGATTSFVLNRAFVFRSEGRARGQLPGFALLYLLGMAINTGANALALTAGAERSVAWFLATAASTCSNFLGMKFIVFARKE